MVAGAVGVVWMGKSEAWSLSPLKKSAASVDLLGTEFVRRSSLYAYRAWEASRLQVLVLPMGGDVARRAHQQCRYSSPSEPSPARSLNRLPPHQRGAPNRMLTPPSSRSSSRLPTPYTPPPPPPPPSRSARSARSTPSHLPVHFFHSLAWRLGANRTHPPGVWTRPCPLPPPQEKKGEKK
ncbi:hypothetical protein B0H14DRAFT_2564416 [Mycena olivaceomarginata]|nr:hypothetical protein B0H14DRAFT_2564416 [Mycena olivaceomarginata]